MEFLVGVRSRCIMGKNPTANGTGKGGRLGQTVSFTLGAGKTITVTGLASGMTQTPGQCRAHCAGVARHAYAKPLHLLAHARWLCAGKSTLDRLSCQVRMLVIVAHWLTEPVVIGSGGMAVGMAGVCLRLTIFDTKAIGSRT